MSSTTVDFVKCNHENICEDNGEGASVCIDCGIIQEPVYLYSKKYLNEQTDCGKDLCKNVNTQEREVLLKNRQTQIDLINKLQEKWCFPNYVIDETIKLFSILINKNKKIRYHKKTIFALAFHKALINNNCSHSLYELCRSF